MPFFSRYRLGVSRTRNVDLSDNVHEVQHVTGQLMTKVTPEVAFPQIFKFYAVSRP